MKAFIYARKSTESEDKQILSLDSQLEEAEKLAESKGLKVLKVYKEAKSAKMEGTHYIRHIVSMRLCF